MCTQKLCRTSILYFVLAQGHEKILIFRHLSLEKGVLLVTENTGFNIVQAIPSNCISCKVFTLGRTDWGDRTPRFRSKS